jgi:hypothetical protein
MFECLRSDDATGSLARPPNPPVGSARPAWPQVIMLLIGRFSDTRPDRPQPPFPAGGDCRKKPECLITRAPPFLCGQGVTLTPGGIVCKDMDDLLVPETAKLIG